tara:strand:+ start:1792 stop:1977 length:186 start_codon:yes stop_codon:yes gene_type:complete
LQETCILQIIITDKEKKQTPQRLSENELRKLSDKEFEEYCSKTIKELARSFMEEVEAFEVY